MNKSISLHLLFALLAIVITLMPIATVFASNEPPSGAVGKQTLLYCTTKAAADAMASSIAEKGQGVHMVSRPHTCYYNELLFRIERLVSRFPVKGLDRLAIVVEVSDVVTAERFFVISFIEMPDGYSQS